MANKEKESNLFREFLPISKEQWMEKITQDLKGADFDKKLVWKTYEGFNVQPFYRQEDLEDLKHLNALPGEYPFTRGNDTDNNNWEIRQDIKTQDVKEASTIACDAFNKGADAVAFNVKGIDSYEDLVELLKTINLEKYAVHFTSCSSYPSFIDHFTRYIAEKGIDKTKVRGSVNFDSLSWLLLHGEFYTTNDNNFLEAQHVINNLANLPNFKAITINGHYFHNAGASAVQELAFSLASANEYLAQLTAKGSEVNEVAPKMMFSFGIGSSYFMEIAKLRAARILWAKIVEQYKGDNEAQQMFIHTVTSEWNKTIYDPYVNMLRTTTESMSGAIGGTDSMTVQPFDITFKKSDAFSNRVARNQQIILKGEAYFDKIVDPAAGSYYIEQLTDSIALHAWDLFKAVENKGGFIAGIKSGFIYKQIEATSQKKIADISKRKNVFVGTNNYPNSTENMLDKLEPTTKLTDLAGLKMKRGAEDFETLRMSTEDFEKRTGKRPSVLLCKVGNPAMRTARAMFSANFFAVAGYTIIDEKPFETIDQGLEAVAKHDPTIVVICSSDDEYATFGIETAKKIKERNANTVVVIAGNPTDHIDNLKAAGVDEFIHVRVNILEALQKYNSHFGIN